MNRRALTLSVVLLAAGCRSQGAQEPHPGIAQMSTPALQSAPQASAALARRMPEAQSDSGPVAGGMPRLRLAGAPSSPGALQPADPVSYLAYAYALSLEVPGERLTALMDGHVAACRAAGLRVCQLVSSTRNGDPLASLYATISLRAEPQWLQTFMKQAQADVIGAAGRVTAQATTTDDLTREIVDTEAMLRAKRSLRDRLQQLLASRPGSLSDLLGVERELARVQGEIDSTESTLAAMRTRVAMSMLTISYASSPRAMASGTFAPLGLALVGFLEAVVESTATLITVVGGLLPWVVAVTLVGWILLRLRRRRRARTASGAPPTV